MHVVFTDANRSRIKEESPDADMFDILGLEPGWVVVWSADRRFARSSRLSCTGKSGRA